MPDVPLHSDAHFADTIQSPESFMHREFHWKDNWFWWRNEDGSVSFEHRIQTQDENGHYHVTDIEPRVTIDAHSWASIVASVSKNGETTETYYQAIALHNDGVYDPHVDENGGYQYVRLRK